MINWKAVQAYNCGSPDFKVPGDVNVSQMAGGSYHANLHKAGVLYKKSAGGIRKKTGKATLRIGVGIYKEKTFNNVVKVIQ